MNENVPMSQQESIAPKQASRLITAERRVAMAEERARMLGLRRPSPSVLEEAAAQWRREQEARKRVEQARLILSRRTDMSLFSLQRVALQVQEPPPEDDPLWKVYVPPQVQRQKALRPRRGGGIAVGAFAIQLLQKERARARRQTPPNLVAPARRRRPSQDGR